MCALMTKHSSPDVTRTGRYVLDNPVWYGNSEGIVAQLKWIDILRRILGIIYPHYKCGPQEVDSEEKWRMGEVHCVEQFQSSAFWVKGRERSCDLQIKPSLGLSSVNYRLFIDYYKYPCQPLLMPPASVW